MSCRKRKSEGGTRTPSEAPHRFLQGAPDSDVPQGLTGSCTPFSSSTSPHADHRGPLPKPFCKPSVQLHNTSYKFSCWLDFGLKSNFCYYLVTSISTFCQTTLLFVRKKGNESLTQSIPMKNSLPECAGTGETKMAQAPGPRPAKAPSLKVRLGNHVPVFPQESQQRMEPLPSSSFALRQQRKHQMRRGTPAPCILSGSLWAQSAQGQKWHLPPRSRVCKPSRHADRVNGHTHLSSEEETKKWTQVGGKAGETLTLQT